MVAQWSPKPLVYVQIIGLVPEKENSMEKLNIVYKKVDELIPYENNPRKNDDAVDYVANSIKEFGFKVPIVIDKKNVIVTGHTRYKASQQLGLKEVPCLIADDLDEKQIKAFRIADNKVADFSYFDNARLLEELEDLDDIFTGFDPAEYFDKTLEELDEKDNSVLLDNEEGLQYSITIKSNKKEDIEKIKDFCIANSIVYEE